MSMKSAGFEERNVRASQPEAAQETARHVDPPRGAMSNAGWNAFSTLWTIGISFVITPLLIHTMGTDQYGILLLIWSVTGILGLVGFGFGEATLRYIAHYFGEHDTKGVNRVMGATLTLYTLIALIVCVVVFAAAPAFVGWFNLPPSQNASFGWLLRLAALIFGLRAISLTYGAVPMALQRYDLSTKITVLQSVVRSGGYIVLALASFGIVQLVVWDVLTTVATIVAQALIIRSIAPGIKLMPSFSFHGLREIAGFSVFSFLTYGFHMMQRESAKVILGSQVGPSAVAYLGTPESVALRLHMVVASGSETLMPRFSANRDPQTARALFVSGTWASLAVSLVLLVPLIVVLPDLLALWISPEFAVHSAFVGQLVAVGYITQGAYAPAATFFRGTNRPGLVTVVILVAGIVTLLGSLAFIPAYGLLGVGYAYLLAAVPALVGVVHCWYHMFGRSSHAGLLRLLVLPLTMGALAFGLSIGIRMQFAEIGWPGLFILGGLFTALTAALVGGADWLLGGDDAPSKQFLEKVGKSERVEFLCRRLSVSRAR
jgi:O-antigen/teichoic acid export membrane protein